MSVLFCLALQGFAQPAVPESLHAPVSMDEAAKRDVEMQLKEAFSQLVHSITTLDEEASIAYYELSDCFVTAADGVFSTDTEAFCNNVRETFEGIEKIDMKLEDEKYYALSPTSGTVTFSFDEAFLMKDGSKQQFKGAFMYVYQKINGEWKIVQYAGAHLPQ